MLLHVRNTVGKARRTAMWSLASGAAYAEATALSEECDIV